MGRFRGINSHPIKSTMGGLPGQTKEQPDAWLTRAWIPALRDIYNKAS